MPLCGFTPAMLSGLTVFAQGLYEQALKRAQEEQISLEGAFQQEIHEMNVFLAALDEKYYDELKPHMSVDQAMRELFNWADGKMAKGV